MLGRTFYFPRIFTKLEQFAVKKNFNLFGFAHKNLKICVNFISSFSFSLHSLKRLKPKFKLLNRKCCAFQSSAAIIVICVPFDYDYVFCAHLRSSSRGLMPVANSMIDSKVDQNLVVFNKMIYEKLKRRFKLT